MRILSLLAFSSLQVAAACQPASFQLAGEKPPYMNEVAKSASESGGVRRDELLATNAATLRDALNRTRPEFLRVSSFVRDGEAHTPIVYVDDQKFGGVEVLQLIQVEEVAAVQFLRPALARMRYGLGCDCAGGVLAVARRRVQ